MIKNTIWDREIALIGRKLKYLSTFYQRNGLNTIRDREIALVSKKAQRVGASIFSPECNIRQSYLYLF